MKPTSHALRALILLSSLLSIGVPALGREPDRDEPARSTPAWRSVRSAEGRFRARFPARPVVTRSTHRTLLGPIRGSMHAVDLGELRVSVEWHDLPRIAGLLLSADTILDRARKSLLEGVGGHAIEARRISHMGYPARETRYALSDPPPSIERALLVLVEQRIYILIATWPESAPSDADLIRLFESFEVWAP